MTWQLLAIVGPLFFVVYQALTKFFPKDLSPFLVNFYVSLMGAAVMLTLYFFTSESKSLAMNPKHLPLALAIGALIALGNAAIIRAYGLGAPQAGFTSLFYPLLIIYGVALGLLFWKEKLSLMQGFGVALSLGGLFLLTYFKK